jgi:hypothetical protein
MHSPEQTDALRRLARTSERIAQASEAIAALPERLSAVVSEAVSAVKEDPELQAILGNAFRVGHSTGVAVASGPRLHVVGEDGVRVAETPDPTLALALTEDSSAEEVADAAEALALPGVGSLDRLRHAWHVVYLLGRYCSTSGTARPMAPATWLDDDGERWRVLAVDGDEQKALFSAIYFAGATPRHGARRLLDVACVPVLNPQDIAVHAVDGLFFTVCRSAAEPDAWLEHVRAGERLVDAMGRLGVQDGQRPVGSHGELTPLDWMWTAERDVQGGLRWHWMPAPEDAPPPPGTQP